MEDYEENAKYLKELGFEFVIDGSVYWLNGDIAIHDGLLRLPHINFKVVVLDMLENEDG